MPNIEWVATLEDRNFSKGMEAMTSSLRKTAKEIEEQGISIEQCFKNIERKAAALGVGFSLKQFVDQMVSVRGQFQQLEVAFTTMLGNAEKADSLMSQLVKTAATTPFDLQGVAAGAKSLMAYGTAAEDVNEMLVRLGDIAAGMSIPLNDLVYLYGTTMTQGRMFTQDLRQFQGRGIPIAEEIAKVMNVTKEAVPQLVTAGKVTSDVFHQAIVSMTKEGSRFGGLMEAQSKTITGQISNIEDAVDMMFNDLGKKSEGVINTALGGISTLVENYETVGKIILSVASAYGTYKAALIAVVAIQKAMNVAGSVSAFLSLAKSVTSAKDAMALFNLVTKANPLGIVLSVVSAAAVAFGLFKKNVESVAEVSEKFGESAEKATTGARSLMVAIQNTSPTSKAHTDAIKELSAKYKEYGIEITELDSKMSNEKEVVKELTDKHNDLMLAIRAESIERQKANAIQTFAEEYQKAIGKAWGSMKDEIGGDNANVITASLQLAVSEQDLLKLGELKDKFDGARESGKSMAEIQEAGQQLHSFLAILEGRVSAVGKEFGLSDTKIAYMQRTLEEMASEVLNANNVMQTAIATTEQGANAIDGYTDAADRSAYASRLSKMSVSELKSELKSLIDNYNNTTIGVKIVYDEINIPSWMNGLDLKDTRRLAESFTTMLRNNPKATKFNVNGKRMSREEVTERAVGYTKTAEQKQAEADRKQKEKERAAAEAEKNKEKNARKAAAAQRKAEAAERKAENEAHRKAEEAARKRQEQFDVEQNSLKDQANQERATKDAIEKERIENIKDSGERQREEEKEQHRLNLQNISIRAEEMKRKRLDAMREEWEAANTDKTKVWADTPQAKSGISQISLSKDEQAQIDAETATENARWARLLRERKEAEESSMREYLKQYGDYQQQRQAITEEYDKRTREAQTEGEKLMLARQKEEELRQVDERFGLVTQGMADLFADASKKSVVAIQAVIDKYEALVKYMEGHKGNADKEGLAALGISEREIQMILKGDVSIKDLTDRLKELKGELKDRSPYQSFIGNMKEAIAQLKKAETKEEKANAFGQIASSIKDALPALREFGSDLANIFGMDDSKFSSAIDGLGGMMTAGQGVSQMMSGDIVGGAMSAVKGISQVADALDGMFGADYSSYENMVEQYDRLIDVWDTLIDRKQEYIEMSYGPEATKAGQEAIDIIEKQTEAYRNLGREWLNSGASVGSHSQGVRQRKNMSSDDWANVAAALRRTTDNYAGLGGRLEGLFTLSAEELRKLQEQAPEFWAKLNDETQKYLQGIIDGEQKIEDIQKQVKEQITGTSFDSVFDNFMSSLNDLANGSEDVFENVKENWQQMVNSMVLNNIIGEKYKKRIKEWYDQWFEAYDSDKDISKGEIDALREGYNQIFQDAADETKALRESGIINGVEAFSQSASQKGWQSMGQETADELNGRFTALQIAGEHISMNTDLIVTNLNKMAMMSEGNNTAIAEMRDMFITANSYLEDVVKYAKLTYNEFGMKIDTLNKHQEEIYNAIRRA